MREADMDEIADIFYLTLKDFEANKTECMQRVAQLLSRFPLY
jgi:glycine/serine hydroxymethyltransferase